MNYAFLSTGTTTEMVANVISAFGQNIDAVAVIVGIAVAVPLLFVVARLVKGLIVGHSRR